MDLFRREIKFQITQSQADDICKYLDIFCELDKYSTLSPSGYYLINSLYLDNDNMLLLSNKRRDVPDRFSVRIRSYGNQPKLPAYIELKRKRNNMVDKKRANITSDDTVNFLARGHSKHNNTDIKHPFFSKALYHISSLNLSPKVMTQYWRKAYFSSHDPYARVTFDRDLRSYSETEYNIFPDHKKFVNYDNVDVFHNPNSNIILELKCELKVPLWMKGLVRKFELKQSSFSKYDSSFTFCNEKLLMSEPY